MTVMPDFVLPVDKPEGPTSHDVVAQARKALGIRKIGHTGTLDPFASGLLILCVGRATRLAEYLSGLDKTYEATAKLGITTDTLDRDGEVLEDREGWRELAEPAVAEALSTFQGEIEQVPPQFSAKKVDGVAMHRRARRGEQVRLEPCVVTVHSIELLAMELPEIRFRVRCSSGTYLRSIDRDLGEELGVGAHLTALRRITIGAFGVDGAIGVEQLADTAAVDGVRIDPLAALGHLPAVEVGEEEAGRLAHGQRLRLDEAAPNGLVAVANAGALLAVAEIDDGLLSPRKVFVS
jgi:tRNA pseudouridine55 synthase